MKILVTGGSGFIGINLIDFLLEKGYNIINYDKSKPIKEAHMSFWTEGDIMDEKRLSETCEKNNFDAIIHLAARTDTLSNSLDDYLENHVGTQHVLNVIKNNSSIKRAIITSTQYVYKSEKKPFPSADEEFVPHTVYGQSKVLTEQYTRQANLSCEWTIIRPTNIWGPWHMRYPNELWKLVDRGLYFHPVNHEVIRTYGYVKNVVHQIYKILTAPAEIINHKVFYVGDPSVDSYKFLNELSYQLRNKKIKRLHKNIFKTLAKFGDIFHAVKIPFPIYTVRFKNMIEDYPAPTETTVEIFGQAEADMRKNITETISWIKGEGKQHFKYWVNK